MNSCTRNLFLLTITGTMIFTLTGCDLFSPPTAKSSKKTEKPSVATEKKTDEPGPMPANAVARVGSWTLTVDEFNERLDLLKKGLPDINEKDPQTKATVLNELVRQELLVKDAESANIDNMKDIKDAVEDFRRTLLVQELVSRLTKDVTVSEEEAQKYYDENKNQFIKWKVRQIVVSDEATAKDLVVKALQGADFATLAKENSKDKATAEQGGLVPDLSRLPAEVQKALISLDAGATSSVVKAEGAFYIVHVDEKKQEAFSELKKELIEILTVRKQQQAILNHIEQLAQKTKVEVNESLIAPAEQK